MDPSTMYLTAFTIIGGIIFLVLFFHYVPFFLWLSAKVSGVNISLVQLFLMRIRNVPPYIIVPGMMNSSTRNSITAATIKIAMMNMSITVLFNGLLF
jgi:uncharacterized protein YqfA (UPF0365 family)